LQADEVATRSDVIGAPEAPKKSGLFSPQKLRARPEAFCLGDRDSIITNLTAEPLSVGRTSNTIFSFAQLMRSLNVIAFLYDIMGWGGVGVYLPNICLYCFVSLETRVWGKLLFIPAPHLAVFTLFVCHPRIFFLSKILRSGAGSVKIHVPAYHGKCLIISRPILQFIYSMDGFNYSSHENSFSDFLAGEGSVSDPDGYRGVRA
jgi:hypothetical protein